MTVWTPLLAGVAAGLGIALPLGAIGVLIVREGVERGVRVAGVAALAVAVVDLGYALVAVALGARLADALSGVERLVQIIGAGALTIVVVVGVRDLLRTSAASSPEPPEGAGLATTPVGTPRAAAAAPGTVGGVAPAAPGDADAVGQGPIRRIYRHTFLRFVALTAINPMTAVYFVALTAGLSQRLVGPGAGAAFAIGVFLGSLAWQEALAVGGATAGARMSDRLRLGVSLLGYAIVTGYAVKLALGG